jgi:hypothetical protein
MKLIKCCECLFANLDNAQCERNPPDNGRPASIARYLVEHRGCWQGEPRVQRSCRNCGNFLEHSEHWCTWVREVSPRAQLQGQQWFCSKWEPAE